MPLSTVKVSLQKMISEAGGWLSYEKFMALALYAPETGYYTNNLRGIGRYGDFSTSAGAGSVLARALAKWVVLQRARVQNGREWHVIETGGGDGTLALEILKAIGWFRRRHLVYHLVEISPVLEAQQRSQLSSFNVQWHRSIEEALAAARARAILFSNELVDAFPCVRLRWSGISWEEMGLSWEKNGPVEVFRPFNDAHLQCGTFTAMGDFSDRKTGQQVEVHLSYFDHLKKIAANLEAGVILTIDYGDTFPEIYYRQPGGTFRGYFHHLRMDGTALWQRIGHQDLTADVNFTDLQNWGSELNIPPEDYLTQRDFILKMLPKAKQDNVLNARLLDPAGAGTAFKVLQQSRLLR